MKINKKEVKILLYVGGILILLAAYFVGYKNLQEKKAQLQAVNDNLTAKLQQLNEIYDRQDEFKKKAKQFEDETNLIYDQYPSNVQEEDAILYATDFENDYDFEVSQIGMDQQQQVYAMGTGAVNADGTPVTPADQNVSTQEASTEQSTEAAADAGLSTAPTDIQQQLGMIDEAAVVLPSVSLNKKEIKYNFATNYKDCESVFGDIISYADKRNIPSITLAYNEEGGNLLGTMTVDMFFLSGTDKKYVEPDSGVIKHGNENLFGVISEDGKKVKGKQKNKKK